MTVYEIKFKEPKPGSTQLRIRKKIKGLIQGHDNWSLYTNASSETNIRVPERILVDVRNALDEYDIDYTVTGHWKYTPTTREES